VGDVAMLAVGVAVSSTRHSATAGRTLLRVERQAEACRLRIKGLHYAEIAERMGTSTSVAWGYVNKRLQALNALADKEAMHLRRIESERLVMAMKAIADSVEAGQVESIREWRLLSESMRKLWGLDAPLKLAPTSPDGESEYTGLSDAEVERELAAAIAAATAGPAA